MTGIIIYACFNFKKMKKIIVFFLILSCNLDLYCQDLITVFEKNYGGLGFDEAAYILPINSDSILLISVSNSKDSYFSGNKGDDDVILMLLNKSGNIIGFNQFGGSGLDCPIKAVKCKDETFLIIGYSKSSDGDFKKNNGNMDIFIAKINRKLKVQWIKVIGGSEADYAYDIIELDDYFLITGYTNSTDYDFSTNVKGESDIFLLKIDSSGNTIWQKRYGGTESDNGRSLSYYKNKIYIGCSTASLNGDFKNNYGGLDAAIIITDLSGNIIKSKTFGGSKNDGLKSLIVKNDNKIYIGAGSESNDQDLFTNQGGQDYWVFTIDSSLNITERVEMGGSRQDILSQLKFYKDNVIAFGTTSSGNGDVPPIKGMYDGWIVFMDSSLKIKKNMVFGADFSDIINFGDFSSSSSFNFCGSTSLIDSLGHYDQSNIWYVKVDILNEIPDNKSGNIIQYENSRLIINLNNKLEGKFDLRIFNINGKLIFSKLNLPSNVLIIQNLKLEKGAYIIDIVSNGTRISKKFIVTN